MRPRKGAQTEERTTRAAERALRRVSRAGAERASGPEQMTLRLPACAESAVRHPRRAAAPSKPTASTTLATPTTVIAPAAPARSGAGPRKAAASAGAVPARSRAGAAAEGRMSGVTAGPARTVTSGAGKSNGRGTSATGATAAAATSAAMAVRRHFGELREALADGWEIVQPIFARPLWSAPDDSATAFSFVLRSPRGTRLITVPEGRSVARFIRDRQLLVDYAR